MISLFNILAAFWVFQSALEMKLDEWPSLQQADCRKHVRMKCSLQEAPVLGQWE